MALDKNIFGDMTVSGLLETIYKNQKRKDKQITSLIADLRQLILSAQGDSKDMLSEVMTLVPFVRDYVELGIKNDEHLIKLTAVTQRLINSDGESGGEDFFNEAELEQISRAAQKIEVEKEQDIIQEPTDEQSENNFGGGEL
jgi:hypothetical protein